MSTRQRSAVEITDAYLAAIAAAQPSLRAFLATTPDVARTAAAAIDARRAAGEPLGPLAGIPLAIKVCMRLPGQSSSCACCALVNPDAV
jgi:aspartyl-tRNA(Asn)/glutamyl-tRNA(Gln) amidotransferase subunit A